MSPIKSVYEFWDEEQRRQNVSASDLQLVDVHRQEIALCATDIWYYAQFVKTYDEENETIREFPLDFKYLTDKVHPQIEEHQKSIILKARRLLVTWYGMLRQSWRGKFAGTGLIPGKDFFQGAVMTIGEKEAEELIKRIRFIEENLPLWLQDFNRMTVKNQLRCEWESGSNTMGFPLKREGPRSFGFTETFFDEMAFQEAVRSVYTGLAPSLGARGKLIMVSTPNGSIGLFADIWHNKKNKFNDVHRIELNWDDNPEHDADWLKKLENTMDSRMIAREIYKSFSSPAGEPVWPEFDRKTHIAEDAIEVQNQIPMLIGWDFGFHFPACVFAQYNGRDQYVILAELQGYDVEFGEFAKQALAIAASLYDRNKIIGEIHFADPAGMQRYHQKAQSGAVNDYGEIKMRWKFKGRDARIYPGALETGTFSNEGPRLKSVRKLWPLRDDGRPGIVFDPFRVPLLIEGCEAAYCYSSRAESEIPEKNEASHLQDCIQMIVTGYNRIIKGQTKKIPTKDKPLQQYRFSKFRTGL